MHAEQGMHSKEKMRAAGTKVRAARTGGANEDQLQVMTPSVRVPSPTVTVHSSMPLLIVLLLMVAENDPPDAVTVNTLLVEGLNTNGSRLVVYTL